jgi:hypothetical protein
MRATGSPWARLGRHRGFWRRHPGGGVTRRNRFGPVTRPAPGQLRAAWRAGAAASRGCRLKGGWAPRAAREQVLGQARPSEVLIKIEDVGEAVARASTYRPAAERQAGPPRQAACDGGPCERPSLHAPIRPPPPGGMPLAQGGARCAGCRAGRKRPAPRALLCSLFSLLVSRVKARGPRCAGGGVGVEGAWLGPRGARSQGFRRRPPERAPGGPARSSALRLQPACRHTLGMGLARSGPRRGPCPLTPGRPAPPQDC